MGSKVSGNGQISDFLKFQPSRKRDGTRPAGIEPFTTACRNSQKADNSPLKMSQIHLFDSLNNEELKKFSRFRSGSVVLSAPPFGVVIWKWLDTDDSERSGCQLDIVQKQEIEWLPRHVTTPENLRQDPGISQSG
jgi:hypothetical protein